jgi:hypothetical protein
MIAAGLLGLITQAVSGADAPKPEAPPERPGFASPAKIGIPADYRSRWAQLSRIAVSGMHWNQWVIVYSNLGEAPYHHNQQLWWNQEQASGWADGSQQAVDYTHYQPGTVLLKEGFSGPAAHHLQPTFLALMVKHPPGYDAEYGDWEFIQSSPQGKVMVRGPMSAPGVAAACGNCHSNVADRDFVFSTTGMGSK